jgi:hypothetical protein
MSDETPEVDDIVIRNGNEARKFTREEFLSRLGFEAVKHAE